MYVMSCHLITRVCMSHALRCIAHNIHVLNLPAHTTHLLQVADISVFGPFKTYMRSAEASRQHTTSAVIRTQDVAALTRLPWDKATSRHNITAGFKKAGIYPFDRTKITAQIYKSGVLHRQLDDDSSRFNPPPIPLYPVRDSDPSVALSVACSSEKKNIETVTSILALPHPIPPQPKSTRQPPAVPTRYAIMLTEPQIVNTLRDRQEKKEEKERATAERKRKREENKQQQPTKPPPRPRKKKSTGVRLADRLSNKENIPPTSSNDTPDPYAFDTK